MLPILTAQQIRDADAYTIAHGAVTSLELMERVATQCAQRIIQLHRETAFRPADRRSYLVLAGMGNNGGDGLVIARLLKAAGINVRIIHVQHTTAPSPDNASNMVRARELGLEITSFKEGEDLDLRGDEVLIDALFGTGLKEPLKGWLADLVRQVNASGIPVIAVDMPSGLFAGDNTDNDRTSIIRAAITITFEVPKLAQLLAENAPFVGRCEVMSIGLDREFIQQLPTDHFVVQEKDVLDLLPERPRHGHKGTFGHALILAGSSGKAGAAVLAVQAALRSGAGLVTAGVPQSTLSIVQTNCPEAMCSAVGKEYLTVLPELGAYSAIGIGPGLEMNEDTALKLKQLIQCVSSKLLLDADALNILSENRTWLPFLPANTIMTPHPKEFDRLLNERPANDHDRLLSARQLAMKYGCIIVLKGARTAICDPKGKVFFNCNGNPGMAKGGSGDALTGLITGLLAQHLAPLQAAILGVHLHGSAGDIAAEHRGMDGMTVSDLIHALPEAWKRLRNASNEIVGGTLPLAQDPGFTL